MKVQRVVVTFLLLWAASATASDSPKQDGKDLIDRAVEKTNIFALPYFEMKGNVRIDNQGKPLDGSYLLLWNGPQQWREEINFPGYVEVQLGGKGVVFLKRSTDFMPLRIDQLHSALGYGSAPNPGSLIQVAPRPNETIKKVKGRKVNSLKVDCAEIADEEKHTREVCVDASTGTLVRQQPFLDREMMPVGAKLFPRFLSYVREGKSLAEIQITELKTTEQFPSSAFEPPPGALSRPGCMNPSPARLIHRVMPRYPEQERQSHIQGTVNIYALVGKEGSLRELQIASGVTPGLDNASLDAVRQWRYEPATCNGTAVDVEAVLTVNYTLE